MRCVWLLLVVCCCDCTCVSEVWDMCVCVVHQEDLEKLVTAWKATAQAQTNL